MSTFKIEIETGKFGSEPENQIARLLTALARELEGGGFSNSTQWLRDENGARCGTWKYESRL